MLTETLLVDDEEYIGRPCITVGRRTHIKQEVLEGKASTSNALLATSNLKTCYALVITIRRKSDGEALIYFAHINQYTNRESLTTSIKKFINEDEITNIGYWGGSSTAEITEGTDPYLIIRDALAEVRKIEENSVLDGFFQGNIAKDDVLAVDPSGESFLANFSKEPSLIQPEVSKVNLAAFKEVYEQYLQSSLLRRFFPTFSSQSESTRKLIQLCLNSEISDIQRFYYLSEYYQNPNNHHRAFYNTLKTNAETLSLKKTESEFHTYTPSRNKF